MYSLVDRQS